MSQIVVQEVVVDTVKKGRNSYQVASVTYTDGGKNFTKKIMSFSNPQVFEAVQNAKQGETYDVSVVKDGEYWNWSAIKPIGALPVTAAKAVPAGTVKPVSTYETADERKLKQLYIIRQSSLSNALEYLDKTQAAHDYGVTDVLDIAQEFVDFVYGNNETLAEMDSDIPY